MKRNEAESKFAEMFQEVKWASWTEDVHEHWDLSIGGLKVDVKGIKRVKRGGKLDDTYHWVELKNVNGKKGWLYGKADFIAFELEDSWLVVDRLELVDFIESKIEYEQDSFPLYKVKTRPKRSDLITLVLTTDLVKIGVKIRKNVFKQDTVSGETAIKETKLRPWHLIYLFIRQGKGISDQLL